MQQIIVKGIRELLFQHNYLVLPRFGGFVLKPGPAHLSASGGQLLAPSKTLSFNAQLRQNDGILALWLQNRLGCGSVQALEHLHDFAEFCSSVLAAKRRLSLERLGFFYLDFENNTCFEPHHDANFLPASFGLGPVSVRELNIPRAEPDRPVTFTDRILHTADPVQKRKSVRSYRRLLAPVALSVLAFTLLLAFVSNSKFSGQLRASVFGKSTTAVYHSLPYPELALTEAPLPASSYVADANGVATLDLGNNKQIAVKVIPSVNLVRVPPVRGRRPVQRAGFEIVFGCFTVLQNASAMAAKLNDRDVSAELSGRNERGMYIVSSGAFSSRQEAVARLGVIRKEFPKAWIKKRNP